MATLPSLQLTPVLSAPGAEAGTTHTSFVTFVPRESEYHLGEWELTRAAYSLGRLLVLVVCAIESDVLN